MCCFWAPPPSALPRRADGGGGGGGEHLGDAAGGWHSHEEIATPCPPAVRRPSREEQHRLATGGSSKSPGRRRGARSSAVHLRDIVSPNSTGWGEHSSALELPTLSLRVVGCIELQGEPLTGSTRPSEKKQRQLLPSTEFPDPSCPPPLLAHYRAAPEPLGGVVHSRNQHYYATTTTEPQMWARRVNLKLKSMSRDGRFQQVTMAPVCGFAHCVFFSPWSSCVASPVPRDFQARRHRRTC